MKTLVFQVFQVFQVCLFIEPKTTIMPSPWRASLDEPQAPVICGERAICSSVPTVLFQPFPTKE